jgi:hypothetical protein
MRLKSRYSLARLYHHSLKNAKKIVITNLSQNMVSLSSKDSMRKEAWAMQKDIQGNKKGQCNTPVLWLHQTCA